MNFIQTELPEVWLIEPVVFGDDRGYFVETFKHDLFINTVGNVSFVQDNESKSSYGVLRGLHYQKEAHAQAKLVRVITGKVLDVAVDIRKNSSHFGKYVAVELTGDNKKQLFIPRGFAHGFIVLSPTAIFSYKVDNIYSPQHEGCIRYDDPSLNINWQLPLGDIVTSPKDRAGSFLSDI